MKLHQLFLLLSSCFALHSCARYIETTTNTFADVVIIPQGFPQGSSFVIVPEQREHLMLSKEVSQKMTHLLHERGYRLADAQNADYLLHFNFAMTKDTKIIHVPTYIPGPVQTKTGNVSGSEGSVHYDEQTQSSGTVIYRPEERVFFNRELCIKVYDRHEEQVWQGFSVSTGSSSDLREAIDYLLVSAFHYFGQNTKKNVELRLESENATVKWLKDERPHGHFAEAIRQDSID